MVQDLYIHLLEYLYNNGLVQQSLLSSHEVSLYYSSKPELFILSNGSLFMSDSLLEQTLKVGGLEALAFLLLHELSHIIKSHLRMNLLQLHPYGDLKRQLFLFNNQYTGFDALFIDHFTNTRYTLD